MSEQTHQEEKRDEAHLARLDELMKQMIKSGFVHYVDKSTGKKESLNFETIISEGIETKGVIPSMFRFMQCVVDGESHTISQLEKSIIGFIESMRLLTIEYIEGDVIACEEVPTPEPE